jgi:hypothetical protein
MENNNNIRINIREPSHLYGGICGCNNCLRDFNRQNMEVQIQVIYNDALRNIRMNELLNSFNFLDNFMNYFPDNSQEDFINSLFQQASASEELERNDKIKLDVQSQLFSESEKTFSSCSICSDDYKDDDTVSTLNCKHIFHKNCIEEWGHYNPVCPVCKASIKTQTN